jgi:hypothetical protein
VWYVLCVRVIISSTQLTSGAASMARNTCVRAVERASVSLAITHQHWSPASSSWRRGKEKRPGVSLPRTMISKNISLAQPLFPLSLISSMYGHAKVLNAPPRGDRAADHRPDAGLPFELHRAHNCAISGSSVLDLITHAPGVKLDQLFNFTRKATQLAMQRFRYVGARKGFP